MNQFGMIEDGKIEFLKGNSEYNRNESWKNVTWSFSILKIRENFRRKNGSWFTFRKYKM